MRPTTQNEGMCSGFSVHRMFMTINIKQLSLLIKSWLSKALKSMHQTSHHQCSALNELLHPTPDLPPAPTQPQKIQQPLDITKISAFSASAHEPNTSLNTVPHQAAPFLQICICFENTTGTKIIVTDRRELLGRIYFLSSTKSPEQ